MNLNSRQVYRLYAVLWLLGCFGPAAGPQALAQSRPSPTRILFVSTRDGNPEIYCIDSEGSNVTRLTKDPASDQEPKWSPDGRRIAFRSNRDGNEDIYVMDADGTNVLNVTRHVAHDEDPSWSPDGASIVFTSTRDGNPELYTSRLDGSAVGRLTNNSADDGEPCWSPDGSRIAFRSDRDGDVEIYLMNADGTGIKRLTRSGGRDECPRYSPDGRQIAFSSERNGNRDIFVVDADGSNVKRVTTDVADEGLPTWSPDGQNLAYALVKESVRRPVVWVIALGNGEARQLTPEGQVAFSPSWSPPPAAATVATRDLVMKNDVFELAVIGSIIIEPLDMMIGGRRLQVRCVKLPIRLHNLSSEAQKVNASSTLRLGHPKYTDAFRLLKNAPGPMVLEFSPGQFREITLEYVMNPSAPSIEDGGTTYVIFETFLGTKNLPLPRPRDSKRP